MPENETARKIKELRLSQNLTLEQIATEVGVGKSTVRKWETGMIANMRRDKIASLARALHTSPAYLMGWTDDPSIKIESPCSSSMDEQERTLLEYYRQLNPEGQEKLVDYAQDLVASGRYTKNNLSALDQQA